MALNQFGAVMTFAIELEGRLAEFYEKAAQDHPPHTAEFKQRAEDARKRRKKIEISRTRDVTEITLQPIEGLDEANYQIDLSQTDIKTVNMAEEVVKQFYNDATPKINVRESRKVLERCLKDHVGLEPIT
jgi:hypothetical protein